MIKIIKENSKLNIGCGNDIKNDYINIDNRILHGVDIVADIFELNIGDNILSEIFISDFLEHFSEEKTIELLDKFYTALKPNGILDVRVPDLKAVAKELISKPTFKAMFYRIYGGQDYSGNFHYWGWTPESFKELISGYNFEIIEENYISWNMNFKLRKGENYENKKHN